MKIRELKRMLEDCDDNADIPWTFQGEPYSGGYFILTTNGYNEEIRRDAEAGEVLNLFPENSIYIGMDL